VRSRVTRGVVVLVVVVVVAYASWTVAHNRAQSRAVAHNRAQPGTLDRPSHSGAKNLEVGARIRARLVPAARAEMTCLEIIELGGHSLFVGKCRRTFFYVGERHFQMCRESLAARVPQNVARFLASFFFVGRTLQNLRAARFGLLLGREGQIDRHIFLFLHAHREHCLGDRRGIVPGVRKQNSRQFFWRRARDHKR